VEAFQTSLKFIEIYQYLAQTEELCNSAQNHYIKILSSGTVFIMSIDLHLLLSCIYTGSFSNNSFTSYNILQTNLFIRLV